MRDLARQLRATAQAHLAYSQVVDLMQVVDMHINALAHIEEMHGDHAERIERARIEAYDAGREEAPYR